MSRKTFHLAAAASALAITSIAAIAPAHAGPHAKSHAAHHAPAHAISVSHKPNGTTRHVRSRYARVSRTSRDVVVDAPTTTVETRGRRVAVDAPFAHVRRSAAGVHVRAPFVELWVPRR